MIANIRSMYHLTLDDAIAKNICECRTTTYRDDYQPHALPRHNIDPIFLRERENVYRRCAIIDVHVPNKNDPHGQCETCKLPEWLRLDSKNIAQCRERILPLHITAEQHRGIKDNNIPKCEELKLNRFYENSMSATYPQLYRSINGKHICDETTRRSSLRCYI